MLKLITWKHTQNPEPRTQNPEPRTQHLAPRTQHPDPSMLHFTTSDIRSRISMATAVALMKDAFRQLSSGKATVPVRTVIDTGNKSGRALFMPSYSPAYNLFGLKMVSVFANNPNHALPAIQGLMMVMDGKTGTPLATFDAEYLTALRTGAASGLATDILSGKESKILALFGTGGQAETQLEGILAVRKIEEVIVFGQNREKIADFCKKVSHENKTRIYPGNVSDLKRADIICTATTSTTPVFRSTDIKDGVHINGIGSFKPDMQEIPEELVQVATLIVDQRAASLEEAGDIVIPLTKGLITKDHIKAELGEIVDDPSKGRRSHNEITIFKSVGNAIQDLALANYLLK